MEITGKTAIVTGASRGIGRAVALALAKRGAHLAIAARSRPDLDKVAREAEAFGCQVLVFAGDLSDEETIRTFVSRARDRFGALDILVNNAGVGHFYTVAEFPTDKWDEMFGLNTRGLFLATRECLPHLRESGESVVANIASIASKNTFARGSGYAGTKHAVLAFSRCLMLEERQYGVRVLAICPGSVRTDFFSDHDVTEERLQTMLDPDDVAESTMHMIELPQRAMVSEIDIRPSNPKA